MPIMRNPFRRTPGDHINDENARPNGNANGAVQRRWDTEGSTAKPLTLNLKGETAQEREYKLSEINDSGVYLPPSPPAEKRGFWSSRSSTSTRTSTRNALNENEPFNISRESFDSYRRSFDISARSPIPDNSPHRSRQSLDVRAMRLPSSQSFSTQASFTSMRSSGGFGGLLSQNPSQRSITTISSQNPTEPMTPSPSSLAADPASAPKMSPYSLEPSEAPEMLLPRTSNLEPLERIPEPETDRFEEVTLHDPKPKRHGIFARFGGGGGGFSGAAESGEGITRPSSGTGHSFFGRKRATSGQGAELGSLPARGNTVKSVMPGSGPSFASGSNTAQQTPAHSTMPQASLQKSQQQVSQQVVQQMQAQAPQQAQPQVPLQASTVKQHAPLQVQPQMVPQHPVSQQLAVTQLPQETEPTVSNPLEQRTE